MRIAQISANLIGSFLLLLLALPAAASINVYEFEEEEKRQRFDVLIQELRCPKCQNQNIADSDAGVAKLIKDRVYKLVQEGKSEVEITDHMIERYGDFVTYRPPVRRSTFFLWFGPVLALLIAVVLLIFFVSRDKQKSKALSNDEEAKLQQLLKKYESDSDRNSQDQ